MTWQYMWQLAKSDYFKLVPLLAVAFYLAFIPHLNYPYPVHIDEWVHLACSQELTRAGSVTTLSEPFYGGSQLLPAQTLEVGFHILWGIFQQISGIPWMVIFRYFPSIIFMVTVLSVYILAHRQGFGWEAALFTCLIPTTVGIMGPAFLVPIAIGLLFLPLSLFTAFEFRSGWSYLVLFLFASFLISIHSPSTICLVIIVIPYVLLNLKGQLKHSLSVILALSISFLVPLPMIFDLLLPTFKSLFSPTPFPTHIDFPRVIETYGILPILFCLTGTFVLAMRGGKRGYSLVLGLLALLVMLATFFTLHYGVSIVYQRGLTYAMLMMGIVAGAGLKGIESLRLRGKFLMVLKVPHITQNLGPVLCLVLVTITLAISVAARQSENYYHVIDKQDYESFVWIRDNVDCIYEKAILDPWKATSFTAITGKKVYTRIHALPQPPDVAAHQFLSKGCTDTDFLRKNGISIVYTRGECQNPDLRKIRENIYILEK